MKRSWLPVLLSVALTLATDDPTRPVVKVNGTAITAGDVEFTLTTQRVKPDDRAARSPAMIEELIDRQVIREFLTRRKITAPADDLAYQIQRADDAIRNAGDDPAKLLPKLGYTQERLKSELGLPLAWQAYVRQTVTLPQTKEYFQKHSAELDGTRVRARQIFLKLPPNSSESAVAEKVSQLKQVKSEIASGKTSFADAAKKVSESPTREQGGELGTFGFGGKLPSAVIRAAFDLKVNDISEPVVSAFGVHLIQVTQIIPGDLSLEDVRPLIFERLSDQLWKETVVRERKAAKIDYVK